MHIICNKRTKKIDVPNMQKQNNKYMHALGAMCLIKIENAIIIIIKHVQNDIC
jgi:hypothetical protein